MSSIKASAASYDRYGAGYAATRRADPTLAAQLAVLLQLSTGREYLDIGCGTGTYTRALSAQGGTWHGVDASAVMLDQARAQSVSVTWHQAAADALPFDGARFDGAVCVNAIHHFASLECAFIEVRRVLRQGRLVIFTCLAELMVDYWLCHYFPKMMRRSMALTPSRVAVREALLSAGFSEPEFVRFDVTPALEDLFLYCGKDRPALYLREDVRSNITTFARHGNPEEIERGLVALRGDIESGAIDGVRARYPSRHGDYAFLAADAT